MRNILSEIAGSTVKVVTVNMEGLDTLAGLRMKAWISFFRRCGEESVPRGLKKLRGGGLAVFHNAMVPRPLDELFEMARREFKPLTIPSSAAY